VTSQEEHSEPRDSAVDTLRRLEESLYASETRFDPEHMDRLLAPDFVEFGASGRVWTRQHIIRTPPLELEAKLPLPEFSVLMLSDDIALVTYRSEIGTRRVEATNRSSVWRRTYDGWKLVFHQGTPASRY
jgi:hypothetical protein